MESNAKKPLPASSCGADTTNYMQIRWNGVGEVNREEGEKKCKGGLYL